jgi:hypothetical protein
LEDKRGYSASGYPEEITPQAHIRIYLPDGAIEEHSVLPETEIVTEKGYLSFIDFHSGRSWEFSDMPFDIEYYDENRNEDTDDSDRGLQSP